MKRTNWLSFVVVLALSWPALAAIDVQTRTVAGITYLLSESPELPIIEVRLFFKDAGVVSDAKGKEGRASLAAEMLMEGAGTRSANDFHKALEQKAIQLSVDTSRDGLSVSLKTLAEHKEAAFSLLADMLLHPHFDEEALAKVKQQMAVQRQRAEELPSYLAKRAFAQAAYGAHPYAQPALGTDESVAALSRDDLFEYQQRYFTKANLTLSFAGALAKGDADRLVSAYLNALPARAQRPKVMPAPTLEAPVSLSVSKGLPQSFLLFARPAMARSHPDFYAAYLLNHIVGGGSLTSQLGLEVRKKRGLTYGVGTALEPSFYASVWAGAMATQNDTADEAMQAVRDTFDAMHQNGISDAQLQAAKDYVIGAFPLNLDSNASIVGYLQLMQLYNLGPDYLANRNDYFAAVSAEQINALATHYLDAQAWSWVRVGPKK
jgi:zinc protease